MKTLYLLRHAKTESAKAGQDDLDRALTPRGLEACETIGHYFKEKKYSPSLVLASPAKRTRETFALVMQSAELAPKHEFEKFIYMASAERIINHLQMVEDTVDSLMIIGHNPGMHHLALTLAQPKSSDLHAALELKYPTGALTVLRFAINSWSKVAPGEGELIDFATPAEL